MNLYKNEKNYCHFVVASLINSVGNDIIYFLIPWIILNITESTFWMGNIFLLQLLPSLIISPVAGYFLDKYNKKKIILNTNVLMILILLSIFIYLSFFEINIIFIIFITIILSILNSFSFIGEESIVINLVDEKNLNEANGLYQISESIATIVGPSLAGLMLIVFNLKFIFLLLSLMFIPMAFLSYHIKYKNETKNQKASNFSSSLKNTLKFIGKTKILCVIIVFCCLLNLSLGSIDSMLIYYSSNIIGLSSYELGIVVSLASLSQFLFSIWSFNYSKKFNQYKLLLFAATIICIGLLTLIVSNSLIIVCIARMLQTGPIVVINVINKTLRQRLAPNEILGQVNSINGTLSMITYPVSGFISGIICTFLSIRYLYSITLTILFFSVIGFMVIMRKHNLLKEENLC